ncbi:MAG: hypothetical protein WA398_06185 [Nitrososphaeraceae archaeon]
MTKSNSMIDKTTVNVYTCKKCDYKWLGGWDNKNDRQDRIPFYCPHCKNVRWNQEYREEEKMLFEELYRQHIVKVTTEKSRYKSYYNSLNPKAYPTTTNRIAYLDFIAFCFFYGIRPQPDFFELKQVGAIPKKNLEKRHELMFSIIFERISNVDHYKQERYSKIIGKGKDKDYSYYYKFGKDPTHQFVYENGEDQYDLRRAVELSEQPKECKHRDHYAKLSDMIKQTHKLSSYHL